VEFMNSISIKHGIVSVAILSISVLVTLFFLTNQNNDKQKSDHRLISLLQQTENDKLMFRRFEKDFILRLDAKYSKRHQDLRPKITQRIAEIDQLVNKLEQTWERNQISEHFEQYFNHFDSFVELSIDIGLDEGKGLRGALRKIIHAVEEESNAENDTRLLAHILMLRRLEKDFLYRNNIKYLSRHKAQIEVTQSYLEGKKRTENNQLLLDDLARYQENFISLANAKKVLGLNSTSGIQGEMRKAVHQLEEILSSEMNRLQAHAVEESAFLRRVGQLTFLIGSLIIILTLAFMAWQVMKRASRAIIFVDELYTKVQDKNFEGLSLLTIKGSDEFAKVSRRTAQLGAQIEKLYSEMAKANSESQRIKQALDVARAPVIVADGELNIIYQNQSLRALLLNRQEKMNRIDSALGKGDMLGFNLDELMSKLGKVTSLGSLNSANEIEVEVDSLVLRMTASPIFTNEGERLGAVVEWHDATDRLLQQIAEKQRADENQSIKLALDVCDTNVMMADNDFNINYMNSAVNNMMMLAEADLKVVLPNFDANNLVGKNIDVFHKNPAHQRAMMSKLQKVYRTEIKVGVRTFGLTATPIFNEQKERLGTVVEWSDRTIEVGIENEMDNLIIDANKGELSNRLDLSGKSGFFKRVSEGLNNLMENTEVFVNDIGYIFEAISQGDLTKSINKPYQGEFDRIKNNANSGINKLAEILLNIQTAAKTVDTSSNEVAQGTDDLSRRTESQASTLEETAASMEEITATVKQTADSANQSAGMAKEAQTKAEQGGVVVQGAVTAMAEILQSSNQINDIIGVIDEIAFQTNLLALNAAVEAARAGEHGRGFAVVAAEVRALSQRSAAAAKEIKDLIRDSVSKAESGSTLVNQSGEVLNSIVDAVEKVSAMITQVNLAAMEQQSGITQINQAITSMDDITQQNAALVEESSAASRSMSEETRRMNTMIDFFTLR
jgi:methyl-accepting chemotaxis protein